MKNFWIQPPQGFNKENRGLTEEALRQKELENGFRFPGTYRKLMKLQNGGALRKQVISGNEDYLVEYFSAIRFDSHEINNCLDLTKFESDIDELYAQFYYCDPKRLIILSHLGSSGVLCFDYGWLRKEALQEPEIVLIGNDGEDFLHYEEVSRFKGFDQFLQLLRADLEESRIIVGIHSEWSFEEFIDKFSEGEKNRFKVRSDDRQGHYNFHQWYEGAIPLHLDDETLESYISSTSINRQEMYYWVEAEGRERTIRTLFTPNQHLSGTALYPDCTEFNILLEVQKSWFDAKVPLQNFCGNQKQREELEIHKIEMLE